MGIIKTEVEGIYRDTNNNALLNKDNTALDAYKKMKRKNNEIDILKEDVDDMKEQLCEIKTLLTKLAEKL